MKSNFVFSLIELGEKFSGIVKKKISSKKQGLKTDFISIGRYQQLTGECDTCDAVVADFSVYNSQFLDLFCSLRNIPLFMFIDENGLELLKKHDIKNDTTYILKKDEEEDGETLARLISKHFNIA